jgi:hypothetical protein
MEPLHNLSDRDILVLLHTKVSDIVDSLDVINARIDKQGRDISDLKSWRTYLTGAFTIIAVILGFIARHL